MQLETVVLSVCGVGLYLFASLRLAKALGRGLRDGSTEQIQEDITATTFSADVSLIAPPEPSPSVILKSSNSPDASATFPAIHPTPPDALPPSGGNASNR